MISFLLFTVVPYAFIAWVLKEVCMGVYAKFIRPVKVCIEQNCKGMLCYLLSAMSSFPPPIPQFRVNTGHFTITPFQWLPSAGTDC